MRQLRRRNHDGFTLIELLVVTVIIGILATIALMNMAHALRKAREGRTYANLSTLRTAISAFYATTGLNYNFVLPGGNPTSNFPWSLKEGNTNSPPANNENWADDDKYGWTVEKGQYQAYFNKHIDRIPECEVSADGLWGFADGNTGMGNITNGLWQTNWLNSNPASNPGGNYRGWHYRNTDGVIRINNTSLSTEGKAYDKY
jgi:prepilin-type N-terminal cleavage/methylation domain-containing protein